MGGGEQDPQENPQTGPKPLPLPNSDLPSQETERSSILGTVLKH